MTSDCDFEAAVGGAGGLAAAYALALRGMSVIILEKSPGIGQGISWRNSEVIHAGLHYPTNSVHARLCVEGCRHLYEFFETHGVAHEKSGKLIVAAEESEIPRLQSLADKSERNHAEGLQWLTVDEAKTLEPELSAVAALLSTETDILDSHGYMPAVHGEKPGDLRRVGRTGCGARDRRGPPADALAEADASGDHADASIQEVISIG